MSALFSKAALPDLPYSYSALEPVISAEIMELHHSRHHKGYVAKLNAAVDKLNEMAKSGDDMEGVIGLEVSCWQGLIFILVVVLCSWYMLSLLLWVLPLVFFCCGYILELLLLLSFLWSCYCYLARRQSCLNMFSVLDCFF